MGPWSNGGGRWRSLALRPMVHAPPLVAVVDDDPRVRTALQRLLRSTGYAAEGFASGEALLAACDRVAPDCLVLDLHMPIMDGFEVQRRLAARGRPIPVVAITGRDSPAARSRARAGGIGDCLCKPVDQADLLDAVERAMAAAAASGRAGTVRAEGHGEATR